MRTRAEFLKFTEDVAAQALGTVVGSALAYVGAVALGMLPRVSTGSISLILVITVLPLIVALVALRERPASRLRRREHREVLRHMRDEQRRAREEVVSSW
jgi:hypothetical protein